MKVSSLIIGVIAILLLLTNFADGTDPRASATSAEDDLWLSPVNTGDCVAPRISAPRTHFVAQLDEKYCTDNNADEAKARKCIQNSNEQEDFSFFTDRCSEEEYFIGINGKEVRLRRVSKEPGKPHDFIGAFAGEGFSVEISTQERVEVLARERIGEDEIVSGAFNVDITVKHGAIKKAFKGVLMYGL